MELPKFLLKLGPNSFVVTFIPGIFVIQSIYSSLMDTVKNRGLDFAAGVYVVPKNFE